MRRIKQIACFVSVAALLSVLFSACGNPASKKPGDTFQYASFRDIPGVTEDEIKAIELLQEQVDTFIYGMQASIESFENENGEIRGYAALFCEWLTELFGIPFKPKLYEWIDLIAGLETGEISFSGYFAVTEERLKIYHMATPIALRPLKSYRLAGSRPFQEIVKGRPLRCGFVEGGASIPTVTSSIEDGAYEVVLFSDFNFVYDALKNGEIDVFYFSSVAELYFINYSDVIATEFFPLTYMYASMSARNPAFGPIISVVQKALDSGALKHLVELYNTGYQEYLKHKLFVQFTGEERDYIRDHPVIPFAAENANYPVSFYNSREGQWQGIAFDILREVEALTGLRFERVNDENSRWPVILKMLEDNKASMITELMYIPERAGSFLWPDTVNMASTSALISKLDYRSIVPNDILFIKVGLIRGYGHTTLFRKWFPNHSNTVEYESSLAAFNALDRGEVDMVMTSGHELLLMTHFMEHTGYKINYIFDSPFNSAFGFNKNEAVLCSIVDKALHMVNTKMISDQWMRQTYDYKNRLAEAQRPWFVSLYVLALCVLALVAVLFVRSHRAGKHMEILVGKRTKELGVKNVMLTTLFDSIPDLVFTLDTSLRFTQCNKVFLEHFGLNKEDIIDKDEYHLRISVEVADMHNYWNRKVIEEGHTFVVEERIPRFDGAEPLYETVKTPLMLSGAVVGVLGMAHDITKRKEIEEAALAASHSKSVFLANMSHEIRTPMNSIIGFSELAMDDKISPKTKDYLEKIKTNGEWLLQIINDILDISKIESGKMELEKIPFDMHELLSSCRTLVMPKAIEKGILLHFYAEPSLGKKPLGDPTRLRQVLVNLLSNAVKFTNSGMVKLYAAITDKTEETITMHFEVKDSGIGMTPEQVRKIFDPFIQAESGTTRKYGGTGLGLAITKNIVEMMGGTLIVESAVGVGSKFGFKLTFDTIDVSDEEMFEKKIVFNELEKPVFEGEILLCEDNVMNQQVICEHLARIGLKTVVADNGRMGVELVQSRIKKGEKQFDLIFMDMHMPVMDGLEASSKIIGLNANIPIVAMTANIMSNDREIYKTNGINDCVGKPFTSQELWRCLMKYFRPVNWQTVNETQNALVENKLRRKLITNFVKDNKNRYSEITEALNAGDIKLAYRLAHTLKSNSGHLGKISLQQAAANVEECLKDGQNTVTVRQLNALETEINAALAELSAEAASNSTPQVNEASGHEAADQAEPVDMEFAKELIEELEPILQMGSLDCRELADSLRRIPGSGELRQQIEDLDFEDALVSLAELKKNLRIL